MAEHVPFDVQSLLLETDTLDAFLAEVTAEARRRTPGADGCGITLERDGRPFTVASAGASAPPLDDKQYDIDDGPCLQALRNDKEVHVTDMRAEKRWGGYPPFAAAHGTLSSLSLPLRERDGMAGALNLYAPAPDAFSAKDIDSLRLLAAQAAGGLVLAVRLFDAQRFAADLQAALRSRTVIDQAMGVIMGQQRCTAEEAFAYLRLASQNRNVKLRDLCARLVESVSGTPPQEGAWNPRT
ncbi:GAF and ANTAR domain-containing protein [Streptomyces sp. NPDC004959]|uniref:GAF and ANTAR domain-containing protein n=1 Tax=unclassified Streptomyces TaxID=2593676 RepID=UPI0004C9DAA0|nr:GAF and ANTAR domain-containing protein [Streptomyces sp. NRRL F-5630]